MSTAVPQPCGELWQYPDQATNAERSLKAGDAGRLERILPLLACPTCHAGLERLGFDALRCLGCDARFPVRDGVPILLPASLHEPGVGSADADDPVSRHPYSPAALEIIQAHPHGWVLDLGAGGKLQRWDNVLQVDVFRYPMTDVVATADCLPFKDNAFQSVISQAVFEHLQYPEAAAAEIRRVLQPHGPLRIDTAFLQPEHGYPYHFYNATETGLKHWFRDFDIERSGVDTYQHPKWALAWFLEVYLDRLNKSDADRIRQVPVGRLSDALRALARGAADREDETWLAALDGLPLHELRTLAAGVYIQGRNPVKTVQAHAAMLQGRAGAGRPDREGEAARQELAALSEQLRTLQQAHTLAVDRGNYLAQVAYFNVDTRLLQTMTLRARLHFALGSIARLALPPSMWLRWRALRQRKRSAPRTVDHAVQPFFSIITAPTDATSLIKAFFSLTHQAYTSWELIVLEGPNQPVAVRNVARDFAALDRRVKIVGDATRSHGEQETLQEASGRYVLLLPAGFVLAHDALQVVFTLLRQRPVTTAVLADFDRSDSELGSSIRCHTAPPSGTHEPGYSAGSEGDPRFVLRRASLCDAGPKGSFAHIPQVLFRYVKSDSAP